MESDCGIEDDIDVAEGRRKVCVAPFDLRALDERVSRAIRLLEAGTPPAIHETK